MLTGGKKMKKLSHELMLDWLEEHDETYPQREREEHQDLDWWEDRAYIRAHTEPIRVFK